MAIYLVVFLIRFLAAASQDNFMHYVHHSNALDEWMAPAYTALKSLELHAGLMPNGLKIFTFGLKPITKDLTKTFLCTKYELGLYGSYHYNEQWYLSGSLRYIGDRDAMRLDELNYLDEVQKLDPVLDVNTKLHFAYNEQIGFYLERLKLTRSRFCLWRQAPVLGDRSTLAISFLIICTSLDKIKDRNIRVIAKY